MAELETHAVEEREKEVAKIEYLNKEKMAHSAPNSELGSPKNAVTQAEIPAVVVPGDAQPDDADGKNAVAVSLGDGPLNLENEAQIRVLFDKFDKDRSGYLTRDEVKEIYKKVEHFGLDDTESKVDEVLTKYSRHHDGKVGFDEFALLMLSVVQR